MLTQEQFETIENGEGFGKTKLLIIKRIFERNGVVPTEDLLKDLLAFQFDTQDEVADYQENVLHQSMDGI